jgi:putative aldouronate transport system permease protein
MRRSSDKLAFNILAYSIITFFSIICIIPFIMMFSASISDENEILVRGFGLLPKGFSTTAYEWVFKYPETIVRAYGITVFVTAAGTILSLFLMSMASYVIQRPDFRWRNTLSFYFFFTTLFSGGVVPWYVLMVKYMNMKDNVLIYIIPYLFNVFYMIILRTFMKSIPDSLTESAKIDGAGDFRIFIQIIMPLCKPALATIGLFVALNYWNDWWMAMMFINDEKLYNLQYYLYKVLSSIDGLRKAIASGASISEMDLPTETLKNALAVITTGPIILLYPFVQRYFVKGITIGAVKG